MTGTIIDKIWDRHVVHSGGGTRPDLLYVDLHLVQEVSSPQAFEGLRLAGNAVRRPDLTLAVEDHAVPTDGLALLNADAESRTQVESLRRACAEFGIPLESVGGDGQGIVHVIGPELGLTQPGMTGPARSSTSWPRRRSGWTGPRPSPLTSTERSRPGSRPRT